MAPATSPVPLTRDPTPAPMPVTGSRINYCNPGGANSWFMPIAIVGGGQYQANVHLAAQSATGQQVILGRLGFKDNSTGLPVANGVPTPLGTSPANALAVSWVWDATCSFTGFPGWGMGSSGPYCSQAFGTPLAPNTCPKTTGPFAGQTAWPANTLPASYNLSAVAPFVNCYTSGRAAITTSRSCPTGPTIQIPRPSHFRCIGTQLCRFRAGRKAGTKPGAHTGTPSAGLQYRATLPADPNCAPGNPSSLNYCNRMNYGNVCPYTNDGYNISPGVYVRIPKHVPLL